MATTCPPGPETAFVDFGTVKLAVLAAVQGVTEVLPISATAHARLLAALGLWPDFGPAFSGALASAVALALIVWLHRDVRAVVAGPIAALQTGDTRTFEFRLAVALAVAVVPLAGLRLVLRRPLADCASALNGFATLGAALLAVAALMVVVEIFGRRNRGFADLRLRDAVVVGLLVALAAVPGVAVPAAALAGALAMNLDRPSALRWALLVTVPGLLFGGLTALAALRKTGLDAAGWQVFATAWGVTFLAALAATAALAWLFARLGTWPFAVWRLLFGAFLLLVAALGVLE